MTDDASRVSEFRRLYLRLRIDDQRTYYDNRSEEYHKAHAQASTARNVLLLIASFAGFAAQFLDDSSRATAGAVGAIVAALAAALTAFETLIGFEHFAKLFGDARTSLDAARRDWTGTAPGNLQADVDRVEQIFFAENGQWGQLVQESAAQAEPAEGS